MSLPLAPFESDALYELWRASNPNGFVLNTDHIFTKALSVIHKTICSTLAAAVEHTEPGRLTQGTRDGLHAELPVETSAVIHVGPVADCARGYRWLSKRPRS